MIEAVMRAADSDDALVRAAQRGDALAFETLVRRHADRLYAVIRRLVHDEHEAHEVTQEAFLRAWRGLGAFRGEAQVATWLYRIGVNEAKRRLKQTAERTPSSLDGLVVEPSDPAPGPADRSEQRDVRLALEAAVRALPVDYRAPLILRDIEGLSTEEAAGIMGLTPAAFKSRLHRARMSVRAAVAEVL